MLKLSEIEIRTNQVLIKPDDDYLSLRNGLLISGTEEDRKKKIEHTKARHYSITGIVLAAPKNLVYGGKKQRELVEKHQGVYDDFGLKDLNDAVRNSLEYKTTVEVKKDDKVWFDYRCHYTGFNEQKFIELEEFGLCLLIDYHAIFLRERSGNKIPVNGWIWVKPVQNELKETLEGELANPESFRTTKKNVAEVVLCGTRIEEYIHILTEDTKHKLTKGTKILFHEKIATPLEYGLHESEGLEGLLKIKRKDVIGILN
jgi:hypothetical protein